MTHARNWLSRFTDDRRGVSAVEFALILPVLLGLYLGVAEVTQGVNIDRKVAQASRTVADLSAQVNTISNSEMTNILNASTAVMSPYSVAPLKITVTGITVDANSKATVAWSDTRNGSARAVGTSITVPSALLVPSTMLIFSEVTYAYTPSIGYTITGALTLSETMYMRPRLSEKVSRTS